MLTELGGKAGQLCGPAKAGELRCPLMVRPNSEDVVSSHLWGILELLPPHLWVAPLLNRAVRSERFRRQHYRKFRVRLWQRKSKPGAELPWKEGRTEVDVVLTWENPATTVFVEMKYGSELSNGVTHSPKARTNGHAGPKPIGEILDQMDLGSQNGHAFPTDQLIRNARVGLTECGWMPGDLFDERRDFILIYCSPSGRSPLVERYRDPDRLLNSLPGGSLMSVHPVTPFVGSLSFGDVTTVLAYIRSRLSASERQAADRLRDYLELKSAMIAGRSKT